MKRYEKFAESAPALGSTLQRVHSSNVGPKGSGSFCSPSEQDRELCAVQPEFLNCGRENVYYVCKQSEKIQTRN